MSRCSSPWLCLAVSQSCCSSQIATAMEYRWSICGAFRSMADPGGPEAVSLHFTSLHSTSNAVTKEGTQLASTRHFRCNRPTTTKPWPPNTFGSLLLAAVFLVHLRLSQLDSYSREAEMPCRLRDLSISGSPCCPMSGLWRRALLLRILYSMTDVHIGFPKCIVPASSHAPAIDFLVVVQ
ncbi:hypothetical protein BJ546DRAFT_219543 [Cryomyces antarcticus]